MAANKLEFKIVKDVNQRDADLRNLSIQAANAFALLLQSTIKIIELSSASDQVRISIEEGSAVVTAESTLEIIDEIEDTFHEIIERRSSNKDLVGEWRTVQALFSANGLVYEASIHKGNRKTTITKQLTENKPFRARPVAAPLVATLKFIRGKLIAVGGKNPNVHVEEKGERFIINCNEAKAKKANQFLYLNILLTAWVRDLNGKQQLELCDTYVENDYGFFQNLEQFMNAFSQNQNQVQALKDLHYKCREFLDTGDYGHFRKFVRLFLHDSTDVNTLNTILIITQDFKQHEKIHEIRKEVKDLFDKKMSEYRRKKETTRAIN